MSIADQITRLKNAKESIKTSVANKGTVIPENTTLDQYSEYIDQIQTAGNYQAKTVTPTANGVTVNPDTGYDALSSVTVNGDSNLTADNVKKGVTIFDVTGTLESGGNYQEKSITPTANGQTVMPDEGYDALSKVNIYGDEDLVPNNIKEGVSIFGVAGTYSGGGYDLDLLGYDLDIEAGTTITKGQRIVATKNTNATSKTISSSSTGVTLATVSSDLSIGFQAQSLQTDGVVVKLYGANDLGMYEEIGQGTLDVIEDIKSDLGVTSLSFVNATTQTMCLNRNSKNAVYIASKQNGLGYVVVMNINKTSGSITFSKIKIEGDFSTESGNVRMTLVNGASIVDDILVVTGRCALLNSSGETTSTTYAFYALGVINSSGSSFQIRKFQIYPATSSPYAFPFSQHAVAKLSNGNYVSVTNRITEFNSNDVVSTNTFVNGVPHISSNGQYVTAGRTLYTINADMSYTMINSLSSTIESSSDVLYPSDDGRYVLSSKVSGYVYDFVTNSKIGASYTIVAPYFKPERWVSTNSKVYALVPSTEAEYTARQLSSFTMESGKIYGIASESLTVGQRGTARGLFNTN